MGCCSSNTSKQLHPFSESDLSSAILTYRDGCRLDPYIESLDSALQQLTNRVINGLVDTEVRSFSLDSLSHLTEECFLKPYQQVVRLILEWENQIFYNPELFDLVLYYFDNSVVEILDFCIDIEKMCLNLAGDKVQLALTEIQQVGEGSSSKRNEIYETALRELKDFKAACNSSIEDLSDSFKRLYERQMSFSLEFDTMFRHINANYQTLSNLTFVSTFALVLFCTVMGTAISSPQPLGQMGNYINWLLINHDENELNQMRGISDFWTCIGRCDLADIGKIVDKWEFEINKPSMSGEAGFADEVAVVDELKKQLSVFMETVDNLCNHAHKCRHDIGDGWHKFYGMMRRRCDDIRHEMDQVNTGE